MNNLDYNKFKYFLFIFFLLFITKLSYSQEKNYLDSVIERINDLESELKIFKARNLIILIIKIIIQTQ